MNRSIFKVVLLFVVIFSVLAFLYGIFFFTSNTDLIIMEDSFFSEIKIISIENLILELSLLSLSIILSPLGIGIFIALAYVLYNAFSLGFITIILIKIYGIKGVFCALTYFVITKLMTFVLLFLLIYFITRIFLDIIKNMKLKCEKTTFKTFKNMKKVLIIYIIIVINNLLLYLANEFIMKLLVNIT